MRQRGNRGNTQSNRSSSKSTIIPSQQNRQPSSQKFNKYHVALSKDESVQKDNGRNFGKTMAMIGGIVLFVERMVNAFLGHGLGSLLNRFSSLGKIYYAIMLASGLICAAIYIFATQYIIIDDYFELHFERSHNGKEILKNDLFKTHLKIIGIAATIGLLGDWLTGILSLVLHEITIYFISKRTATSHF